MDFSWFLTIPGMLITGGVLLLIIALVIFIATSSKKGQKKETDSSKQSVAGANEMLGTTPPQPGIGGVGAVPPMGVPVPDANSMTAPADSLSNMPQPIEIPDNTTAAPTDMGTMGVTPEPMQQPSVFDNPMQTSPTSSPTFDVPVQTDQPANEAMPAVDPNMGVAPMPVPEETSTVAPMPDVPTTSVTAAPTPDMASVPPIVDSSVGVEPVPAIGVAATTDVAPTVAAPTVEVPPAVSTPVSEAVPVTEAVPSVADTMNQNEPVSIYGGVSPVVSKSDIEQKETHEIYGGASPLDNTQVTSVNEINQAVATPIAEAPQTVVAPVQPATETPQAVATPVQPVTETPQAVAAPVQPVAETPQVVVAPVQPVGVVDPNNPQP